MRLALTDLFKAHWSSQIHEEWIHALLRQGRYTRAALERARDLMNANVRDALVTGHEALIPSLSLPDPDDRHVLAAAIRCNADAIVTFNRKDFPEGYLHPYGIDALHPDDFICYQIDMSPPACCKAIREQRLALRNPTFTVEQFLATLQKQQLPQTVSKLREYADFL